MQFPSFTRNVALARLGIEPEQSYASWLAAIREGDFPINADGTPARPTGVGRRGKNRPKPLTPLPLAVVIP